MWLLALVSIYQDLFCDPIILGVTFVTLVILGVTFSSCSITWSPVISVFSTSSHTSVVSSATSSSVCLSVDYLFVQHHLVTCCFSVLNQFTHLDQDKRNIFIGLLPALALVVRGKMSMLIAVKHFTFDMSSFLCFFCFPFLMFSCSSIKIQGLVRRPCRFGCDLFFVLHHLVTRDFSILSHLTYLGHERRCICILIGLLPC